MISYPVYKIVHYLGIFLLVVALSATLARATVFRTVRPGGAPGGDTVDDPWKRRLIAGHGLGLFLVLLGGFGMLARLEITEGLGLPGWIWAKIGIWGLLGAAIAARRSTAFSAATLLVVPLLAVLAGWVALYKPI